MGPSGFVRIPHSALVSMLERIPAGAFVVKHRRVVAANQLGSVWLGGDRTRVELLAKPGGPDPARFDVISFYSDGLRHHIATVRLETIATGVLRAAEKWRLTRRERMVVEWILRGATNHQIGQELGCATKTVEHHVTSIFRKANVENRSHLIVAAIDA